MKNIKFLVIVSLIFTGSQLLGSQKPTGGKITRHTRSRSYDSFFPKSELQKPQGNILTRFVNNHGLTLGLFVGGGACALYLRSLYIDAMEHEHQQRQCNKILADQSPDAAPEDFMTQTYCHILVEDDPVEAPILSIDTWKKVYSWTKEEIKKGNGTVIATVALMIGGFGASAYVGTKKAK